MHAWNNHCPVYSQIGVISVVFLHYYFEKTFEPSFLKLGAYAAIEFGWGNGDKSMDQIESLSIEEMEKLLIIPGRLTERNLKSSAKCRDPHYN